MKKIYRYISFLIILSICFSLTFVSVRADDAIDITDETVQETVEEVSVDDIKLMDAEAMHTDTFTYVNPVYEGIIGEDDLVQHSDMTLFDASSGYVDTLEEAGSILRSGFAAREATTVIAVDRQNGYFAGMEINEIKEKIIEEALKETDDPTCGDYLRYQYGGSRISISYSSIRATYTFDSTYYTTAEQEEVVASAVSDVIGSLDLEGKDEDYKIARIYDYITSHVVYDYDHLGDQSYLLQYTAYAALINGTAVCQGYANLFYRLCREAGLSARIVSGVGNGGPHAWNIVRIGALYYDLDSTWDAGESPSGYDYFLKCDANFGDHTRGTFTGSVDYTSDEFYSECPMSDTDYAYPDSAKIHVTGVTLTASSLYILPDGTCTVTANVMPENSYDRSVTWETSTDSVSYISSYPTDHSIKIQPYRNVGSIVVTATTNDGNYVASLTVHVSSEPHVHTEEIIPGVAPTATEPGLTDGVRCSVCGEILVAQEVIPATGYSEISCIGHTITLDESIFLNYYFGLPSELLADSNAKVIFSKNGDVVSEQMIADSQLVQNGGITGYVYSIPLVTKELADSVSAVIVDSDGNESEQFVYSAKQYCEELIALNSGDAELVALVKALMNYGASAQEYFEYNTDTLANESLSAEDQVVGEIADGAVSQYETTRVIEDSADLSYRGITLDLLSDLNMRIYFNIPDEKSISDYTFTIADDGANPVALDTGVGRYGPYARITNIYSVDIDAEYTVSIYDGEEQVGTITTSPFAYVKSSLSLSDLNDELRTLLCAMYYYNACAEEYFN